MQQTKRKDHPRKASVIDIVIAITKVNEGHHLILAIDGNTPFTNASSGIAKICREKKVFDALDNNHGYTSNSKSYLRGSHRVDFLLYSLVILITVLRCGMTGFNNVTTSDHCRSFIDLLRNVILKGKLHPSSHLSSVSFNRSYLNP